MKIQHEHAWDLSVSQARRAQEDLERYVVEVPLERSPRSIAGVDVSVKDDRVRAAAAVLSYPDLDLVDSSVWEGPATFPYIPGYLSFREVPVLLRALDGLKTWPDLFMTDGQGRAHPRRFGLACHLGVLLDTPTMGVAKSRLTGIHEEPCREKGCSVPLLDPKAEEAIGAVVRTRNNVKPVFVSVGHRITLAEAIEITLACAPRYKIPEPTREAHSISRNWSDKAAKKGKGRGRGEKVRENGKRVTPEVMYDDRESSKLKSTAGLGTGWTSEIYVEGLRLLGLRQVGSANHFLMTSSGVPSNGN